MLQNIQTLIGSYDPQISVSVDNVNNETDGAFDLIHIEVLPVEFSVERVLEVVESVRFSEYFDLISDEIFVNKFSVSVDIYCEYFTVSQLEVKNLIIDIVHELHNQ